MNIPKFTIISGGKNSNSEHLGTTEIYPITNTQIQTSGGNLKHRGWGLNLVWIGGDTNRTFAVGTGVVDSHDNSHVEVWNEDMKTWTMASSEYQMKEGHSFFGSMTVPRKLVC